MKNAITHWKWFVTAIVGILTLTLSGFSYLETNYVSKDAFAIVCQQLNNIDKKLDRILLTK